MPPTSGQYIPYNPNQNTRPYRYETATMCPECGRLGNTWTIDIIEGNRPNNTRFRNEEYGIGSLSCKFCKYHNESNLTEHIEIIKNLITKQEKNTTEEKIHQKLIQTSNLFNEKIRKNTEQNKPDSGAIRTITGKNHRRFELGSSKGIECTKCLKLFSIKDEINFMICPHCGTEQTINKEQVIQL